MHPSGSEEVLAVIGAGPAGLRAAEVATEAGARVLVCDAQASAGRKFLVAGRGGLNLTHSEGVANFPARYRDEPGRWADLLAEFGPEFSQKARRRPCSCAPGCADCRRRVSNFASNRGFLA